MKNVWLFAAICLAVCSLVSCGGDDEDDNETDNTFSASSAGTAVDMGLSVYWADRNVGASSASDYGHYYAWGETKTKSSYAESNNTTSDVSLSDWSGNSTYDAARANWGSAWRTPTQSECNELISNCSWTWTTQNGCKGYLVKGPSGNSIFLPAAGDMTDSSLEDAADAGCYWTSTPYSLNNKRAIGMTFISGGSKWTTTDWNARALGFTIRPVKN